MNRQEGFTAIEVLITVIIAALMVVGLNALFVALSKSAATTRNVAEANDIAYSNLRYFVYSGAKPPSGFSCSSSTDRINYPNAPGQSLTGVVSVGSSYTPLPQPVYYQVMAVAPYGCSGAGAGSPILITSYVTYGPSSLTVSHSELVGY